MLTSKLSSPPEKNLWLQSTYLCWRSSGDVDIPGPVLLSSSLVVSLLLEQLQVGFPPHVHFLLLHLLATAGLHLGFSLQLSYNKEILLLEGYLQGLTSQNGHIVSIKVRVQLHESLTTGDLFEVRTSVMVTFLWHCFTSTT